MLLARSNMYLLVLFVLLLLLLVVALSWLRVKTAAGTTLKDLTGRILLITAHPDDECMFFAPTVLSLGSSVRAELFLLCLSEGNYYGEGRVRKKELLHSSAILGISGTNVEIVNDEELADGPREEWSESVIENYIISAVHNCTISRIITFDDHGVSGHPNHIAIHRAVRRMCESEKLAAAGIQEVLLLQSTSLLRKYISFIDAAWTSLFHRSVSMHHGREFCPLALWYSVRHPLG
ncbi:N-acetylglucosaminyl-phosphatidylinositol de-N-acetylase [Geodia barretti]|uniref:N-acetylglucosaminylphosphatidylinositol deacetylase n=1 Tax=Geodia barretti TaxID=519541 RepID=A0AA35SW67_GEOBA|nr:N-acetylglucosaminyl-phosphatidylinositol de-N-acetylase [Geodia barretti]